MADWVALAEANADLGVSPSHRGVITAAKRVFVALVMKPQRDFNRALAAWLRSGRRPVATPTGWQREWNQEVLALLDAPTHASLGRALALGKRAHFRKQQAFNEAMVRAIGARHGLLREPDLGAMSDPPPIASPADGPLVSVLTPVFRTPEPVLRECLDSVLLQTYARWELCLVDDGSLQPSLTALLESYARKDSRIRVETRTQNEGIARATNRALSMAKGELVAFLDHDDVLDPHALAYAVTEFRDQPQTDFLYSDEDKLDAAGNRSLPFYKPDWSYELLRSCNYACHFLVARRGLVDGLRDGFDGAQDYDLILRMSERARRVGHVPHLLYHWRSGPQSTALDVANKPMATSAGVRALQEHLQRTRQGGEVMSPVPTNYRVRCESASIAIVTAETWPATTAKVCVFLGPGVIAPDADSMTELAGQTMRPDVGVVVPKVLYADGTICFPPQFENLEDTAQWTCRGLVDWTRDLDASPPHCFAIRTELLREHGGVPRTGVIFTPYASVIVTW